MPSTKYQAKSKSVRMWRSQHTYKYIKEYSFYNYPSLACTQKCVLSTHATMELGNFDGDMSKRRTIHPLDKVSSNFKALECTDLSLTVGFNGFTL